ncbi:hypothetical protein [Candidatus Sulfurimonas baltica]|uniref:Uncharacterized protein n=1 Tax=Candidatus Sulfurimonas baltica TaxID=2740404 RepID=A0A7S7LVK2_9BACT|nr:hypothetical protein [Candidatus Sulfurimonas baltica]QOY52307.1 hypothetical protein HUE88_01025 [Candidatus Sulfurimonas baltica]
MKNTKHSAESTKHTNSFTNESAEERLEALYEEYENSPQYEIDMEKQSQDNEDKIDADLEQLEHLYTSHPDYPAEEI